MRDPADASSLIPSLTAEAAEALINQRVITGGMIPKVKSALQALADGVEKVHMIDGRIPHSLLLEIFTDKGIGTEIAAS
jgi:acetylglutamate kinase